MGNEDQSRLGENRHWGPVRGMGIKRKYRDFTLVIKEKIAEKAGHLK